jgi:NAD(P)-dependent dehydrogenase (short-subunit alcohol dehydrogenase family)
MARLLIRLFPHPLWHLIIAHFCFARLADVKALVETAVGRLGRINLAFNSVGLLPFAKLVVDTEESNWNRAIDVDLKSIWCYHEVRETLRIGMK